MPYPLTTIAGVTILTALLSGCANQQAQTPAGVSKNDYLAYLADLKEQPDAKRPAIVGNYSAQIYSKIRRNWRGAPNDSFRASARIAMSESGDVLSVVITKSSGNMEDDAQIRTAIERSSPLPVPKDAEVFQKYFRLISLHFKSE